LFDQVQEWFIELVYMETFKIWSDHFLVSHFRVANMKKTSPLLLYAVLCLFPVKITFLSGQQGSSGLESQKRLNWLPVQYLIDPQFIVGWGIDSPSNEVLDFATTLHCYCVWQSPELSLVKFWEWYFLMRNYFVFLIIKSGFLLMWSAQPSGLTVVTIMLDDYFKTNPGVKDLPWPGIERQFPSPQPLVISMSCYKPMNLFLGICKNHLLKYF